MINLRRKTHKFYTVKPVGDTFYCGDHYCSGHQNFEVKCSCGWRYKSQYERNIKSAIENHKSDVLEEAAGIRFVD